MSIAAINARRNVPHPVNEPINSYAPGTAPRAELKARLASMSSEHVEIPLIIGGKEVRTSKTFKAVMPFDHAHVLATVHSAEPQHVQQAIDRYGAPRFDRDGLPVFKCVAHDIEAFRAEVARFGAWRPDIADFLNTARSTGD